MEVSREKRGARALMVMETDHSVHSAAVAAVAAGDGVTSVRSIPAV
jgi:hypothetical protein